jgi:hypothetical protein
MIPSTSPKRCVVCDADVSQAKRTRDAEGRYYCQPCWARVAAARPAAAGPAPGAVPSRARHGAPSNQTAGARHKGLEWAVIGVGTLAGLALVGSQVYVLFLRDRWENANRGAILADQQQAQALVSQGRLPEAKQKYGELFALVGEHHVRDATLQAAIESARASFTTVSAELGQAESRRQEADRARQAEATQRDAAHRQQALAAAVQTTRREAGPLFPADPSSITIFEAAEAGATPRVRELLAVAPEYAKHHRLGDGKTPLHLASNAQIVRDLVGAGAELEAVDDMHMPPLNAAVYGNRPDVVRALLAAGANVHATGALILAQSRTNTDMLDVLLQAGADPNAIGNPLDLEYDATPLDALAAAYPSDQIDRMSSSTAGPGQALHAEYENAIAFLVHRGARLDLKDRAGSTVLDYAIASEKTALVRFLKSLR